jgi:hypothetical protein
MGTAAIPRLTDAAAAAAAAAAETALDPWASLVYAEAEKSPSG